MAAGRAATAARQGRDAKATGQPEVPGRARSAGAPADAADAKPPGKGPQWSRIAHDLAAAIEAGRYGDGAALPAAAAIAANYGVHRHTARQALRHLQDLGLVSVERGRGATVTGRRFPYRIGRRVSFRANFGAVGVGVASEIVGSREVAADAATAAALGVPVGAPVWEIRTLNRAAGVAVSTGLHWLSVARFPQFDRRLVAARASITAAFRTYGIPDYVRLSTRLTARRPTPEERRLLGLAPGVPVMQSAGLDGLEDGTPLQRVAAAFAGDGVEFVIEPLG